MKAISIHLTIPQIFEIKDMVQSAAHPSIMNRLSYGELCVFNRAYFKLLTKCERHRFSIKNKGKEYKFSFRAIELEVICKLLMSDKILLTQYAAITFRELREQTEQQSEQLKASFLAQFGD